MHSRTSRTALAAAFAFALAASLAACGGGGSNAPSASLPDANLEANPTAPGGSEGSSPPSSARKLAKRADVGRYKALQLAGGSGAVAIAATKAAVGSMRNLKAAADAGGGQLIGLTGEGEREPVQLDEAGDAGADAGEAPGTGLDSLVDVGDYLLASSTTLTREGRTCHYVLLRKADGELSCFPQPEPNPGYYWYSDLSAQNNVSVSGRYAYFRDQMVPDYATGGVDAYLRRGLLRFLRLDMSEAAPRLEIVAQLETPAILERGYVVVESYHVLRSGNFLIRRMEPSVGPEADDDGFARLVEYWTFTRDADGVLQREVARVDHKVLADWSHFQCFLDHGFGDDDGLIATYGWEGPYRSTLWKIPKPASPTAHITPVQLTPNGGSRLCGDSLPLYADDVIYSLWRGGIGRWDIVTTKYDGTQIVESAEPLYYTGYDNGAGYVGGGGLLSGKGFLVLATHHKVQGFGVAALATDAQGHYLTPATLIPVLELGQAAILDISVDRASENFLVTAEEPGPAGSRIVNTCSFDSQTQSVACAETLREPKSQFYSYWHLIP